MPNKVNYGILFDNELAEINKNHRRPSLLLHVCCAPCASYVLEALTPTFDITVYFCNPNIAPAAEYDYRFDELARYAAERGYNIPLIKENYRPTDFAEISAGLEDAPEKGARCYRCYEQRLRCTANYARSRQFDYFTTTLSISPHKNADWLNQIGMALSEEFGVRWLNSDFKKKDGYKRSIALSKEYNLYRQDYCGCIYSKAARDKIANHSL